MRRMGMIAGLLCMLGLGAGPAYAGLADWELSEVLVQGADDSNIRFIELVNNVGGCLFPASTIDLYDGAGTLIDTQSLSLVTTCYAAPTYLLWASSAAVAHFSVARDGNLSAALPASGQLCFSSSQTNYDCLRWGAVSNPVVDLFGSSDTSALNAPSPGIAMVRVSSSHVVTSDWQEGAPTPGQPNDGSSWNPPDAGPVADAGPVSDAGLPPDAAMRSDARPRADARLPVADPRYLDLDPIGGASGCGCRAGGGAGGASGAGEVELFLLTLALLWWRRGLLTRGTFSLLRRSRRRCRPWRP